jgi:N-acetylglucosamine-6-sulfatase
MHVPVRTWIRRSLAASAAVVPLVGAAAPPDRAPAADPPRRNIVLLVSDDHRHDFLGFLKEAPDFLETPNLDRMAAQGAHLRNAFVGTSLCSPSRASILTGQVAHRHGVIDNQRPIPPGTLFFPQVLREAGYETAFVGKWHMGHDRDDPQPGFDHWASFAGQGEYFKTELNVDGQRRTIEGYSSDVLTDVALAWLKRGHAKPFFLQLCYKAPHFPFTPAPRHQGRYAQAKVRRPETMANTEANYASQPRWVRDRRYGIHGVDHMETGPLDNDPVPSFDALYRQYAETVHGLDENIGRLLAYLDEAGLARSTLVLYLGDNGFALGEHGFYDKRDAFETSIRIPLLAYAPGLIAPGTVVPQMVQNIDVAPTLLEAAGCAFPAGRAVDGRSFLPLLRGETIPWRDRIFYEYYWEWNFPATPTTFALRTDRWKYVFTHGVWDKNGLYDLESDPLERHNLVDVPVFRGRRAEMEKELFDWLESTGGDRIPLRRPVGETYDERKLTR